MSIRSRAAAAALLTAAGTAAALLTPAAAVAAPTSTPSAAAKACDKTPWQAKVQGRPAFHPGAKSGDYLWHDNTGFHLRVTHHTNDKIVFSGQILASAAMRLDPVHLEGRDTVALSADHRYLTFRFDNYGHTDGVDFHTDCAKALQVRYLHANGHAIWHDRINLGVKSAHPAKVPFLVHRVRTADKTG